MAEAVLVHLYNQRPALKQKVDLHVDSAGTDAYHVGESADPRTIQTCKKHGIPISNKARKLRADDWNFDYLLAMDTSHLSHLNRKASTYKSKSHISLFGSFDPTFLPTSNVIWEKGKSIPDPYYGSQRGFEQCYESCVIYSNGFLDHLERSYS
ncbi:hypothetical protein TREMEDRAFT_30865 [Tremella mesenterica DSM 1558]|uniref:uncharacterized protein n=1 Tax=Tremella mesenterica (strain ATCC 24925 / CBS 8224 / DSM 1558 / NBRC 9311 / NRRL Y-6157 / RJB 2259-6 / UBC 559-6) TaxID=578456 RepID=UPI0003F49AE0|nr:uncharacterized protein TREMEDRAFT_30865 [Tremella mesenterica DSM 1558]EIW69354.1 hypothetical protein TREMEDRAFT_30865 [Tremella mesenterica DSM 1558]